MGLTLAQARAKAGLSQTQLALALGRTQQLISYYENGKGTIPPELARSICTILEVPTFEGAPSPRESRAPEPQAAPPPTGLEDQIERSMRLGERLLEISFELALDPRLPPESLPRLLDNIARGSDAIWWHNLED